MNNKISIIMPVYNSEKYLKESIESVLKQEYINWELILIDDGSTDLSSVICNQYTIEDNRIKFIRHTHTGLPSVIRNIGLKVCTGNYITFLDSDDYLNANALSLLDHMLTVRDSSIFIIGNFTIIENNKIKERGDKFPSNHRFFTFSMIIDYILAYLKEPNKYTLFNPCWGRLYSAKIINENNLKFDEDLCIFEDTKFNFEYLQYINKTLYISDKIYNYRMQDEFKSLTFSVNNINKLFDFIKALKFIRLLLRNYLSEETITAKVGHTIISLTIIQLIRICGQINLQNKQKTFEFLKQLLHSEELRSNLKYYSPNKNDSRLIPLFLFLKLRFFLVLIAKYKFKKRYIKI
jgi:glycosyltransferase involved in cell wall biosynthesis